MSTPSSIVGEQNSTGRKTLGSPASRSSSLYLCEAGAVLRAPAKAPFPPLPPILVDLRGMLAPFDAEQSFASARERVGECSIKLAEIRIRGAAVGAAVRRNEAHRIGREPPTGDVETGLDLSSDRPVIPGLYASGRHNCGI